MDLPEWRQVVAGGKERYDSVRNGLCALKTVGFAEDGIVLIHDGARPLVNGEIIARAVDGVREFSACVASMPVKDTIKAADAEGFSASTPDRSTLWQIQTPQAFRFGLIYRAYEKVFAPGTDRSRITDDANGSGTDDGHKGEVYRGKLFKHQSDNSGGYDHRGGSLCS